MAWAAMAVAGGVVVKEASFCMVVGGREGGPSVVTRLVKMQLMAQWSAMA